MRRARQMLAGVAAPAAAATTLLVWQRDGRAPVVLSDGPTVLGAPREWTGATLLGTPLTTTLWITAAVAVLLAAASLRGWRWAAAVAAAVTGGGVLVPAFVVLVGRPDGPIGPWLALVAGAAAVGLATTGAHDRAGAAGPVVLAVALLAGVAAPGLPAVDLRAPRPAPAAVGPFEPVVALPSVFGVFGVGALAVVDGAPVLVTRAGVVGAGADGGFAPVAWPDDENREVLGISGDLVVTGEGDTVTVSGLRPGDPRAVQVTGVLRGTPSAVGADGTLWVQAAGDPESAARVLDPAALPTTGSVAATTLPLVPDAGAAFPFTHPVPGGAVWAGSEGSSGRVELVTVDGARRPLIGGDDPACGYTRDPARTYLFHTDSAAEYQPFPPVATDADGGVWIADRRDGVDRILRLDAVGVLQALDVPLPGRALAMRVAPDGALLLLADPPGSGVVLYRLPDAAGALRDLPAPPADCGP